MKNSFLTNIRKGLTKKLGQDVAYTACGALTYTLVPTFLQGVFGKNMSGWKGTLTGVAAGTALGLGFNKPPIALGAIATFMTHLIYVYGNDTISGIFGSPIFAFDPGTELLDNTGMANSTALPPGYGYYDLGNGRQVIGTSTATMNDYYQSVDDVPVLNDYAHDVNNAVAEYNTRALLPANTDVSSALNDFYKDVSSVLGDEDFESMVMNGAFDA